MSKYYYNARNDHVGKLPILNPLNDSFNADLRLCKNVIADLVDIVLIVMIRPCVSDYDWNYYKEN